MAIVWFLLIASIALVGVVAWSLISRIRGKPSGMWRDPSVPVWADLVVGVVGVIAIISILPGLIWNEPFWAIDHVWRLISKVV